MIMHIDLMLKEVGIVHFKVFSLHLSETNLVKIGGVMAEI
jgi:hypothetical protein